MTSRKDDSVGGTFDGRLVTEKVFWDVVRHALQEVFFSGEKIPQASTHRLKRLRDKANKNKDLAGVVYNLDPFQIAADLAGVAEPTSVHKERYLDLLKQFGPLRNDGYPLLLDEISPSMINHSSPDDPVTWRQRAP